MDRKELRIGNYYKYQDIEGFIKEFKDYNKVALDCGNSLLSVKYDDLKSIKITEEWLVRFKFSKGEMNWFYKEFKYKCLMLNLVTNVTCIRSTYNGFNQHEPTQVRSVETVSALQNITYFLFGE